MCISTWQVSCPTYPARMPRTSRHWWMSSARSCKTKQPPRSTRRNALPVKLIDGSLLMRHEHVAGTLVERREIAQTPPRSNAVLHHAPEAFDVILTVCPSHDSTFQRI